MSHPIRPRLDHYLSWPKSHTRYLVVSCLSGLGNRLRALTAAVRSSERMPDRRLAILWPIDGYHCACPLAMLFSNPFLELGPRAFRHTGQIDLYTVGHRPNFIDQDSRADVLWVEEENFFYEKGEIRVMWGQHGPHRMKDDLIRDELLRAFARLSPHPYVQREKDLFVSRTLAGKKVVGVHVRRGDNKWANAHVPTSLFFPVLDDFPCHTLFFLCTDCEQAREEIRARYPGRVLSYPIRSLARGQSIEAVQDALIEMLILACTSEIVRTPSSTFSQCAAWFGHLRTTEIGPLEHYW